MKPVTQPFYPSVLQWYWIGSGLKSYLIQIFFCEIPRNFLILLFDKNLFIAVKFHLNYFQKFLHVHHILKTIKPHQHNFMLLLFCSFGSCNSNNSVAASISEEWAFEMASILLSSWLQQLHQCISFWNCNDLASVLLPLDVCSSFVSSNVTLLHRCPVCLLRCRTLTLWPDFTLLHLFKR